MRSARSTPCAPAHFSCLELPPWLASAAVPAHCAPPARRCCHRTCCYRAHLATSPQVTSLQDGMAPLVRGQPTLMLRLTWPMELKFVGTPKGHVVSLPLSVSILQDWSIMPDVRVFPSQHVLSASIILWRLR
ncbi:hypothetical protein ZWY2020_024080 [Hordeum vulgare]|nr:hypothetical protein ZWY2020_028400 [Hordeum vulgare]KAI5011946.1 hypothetical protein ZWY2020_024080 [Hordeum vulgare]